MHYDAATHYARVLRCATAQLLNLFWGGPIMPTSPLATPLTYLSFIVVT